MGSSVMEFAIEIGCLSFSAVVGVTPGSSRIGISMLLSEASAFASLAVVPSSVWRFSVATVRIPSSLSGNETISVVTTYDREIAKPNPSFTYLYYHFYSFRSDVHGPLLARPDHMALLVFCKYNCCGLIVVYLLHATLESSRAEIRRMVCICFFMA